MKLDRSITPGRGKYALLKLREIPASKEDIRATLEKAGIPPAALDFGETRTSDFFVIRLKDKYAVPALLAYAEAAKEDDGEYAMEISRLVTLARETTKRIPD